MYGSRARRSGTSAYHQQCDSRWQLSKIYFFLECCVCTGTSGALSECLCGIAQVMLEVSWPVSRCGLAVFLFYGSILQIAVQVLFYCGCCGSPLANSGTTNAVSTATQVSCI